MGWIFFSVILTLIPSSGTSTEVILNNYGLSQYQWEGLDRGKDYKFSNINGEGILATEDAFISLTSTPDAPSLNVANVGDTSAHLESSAPA